MAPPKGDFEADLDRLRDRRRHGTQDDRDPADKPSWRERDLANDRGGKSAQDRPVGVPKVKDRYQNAQAQKELKSQLEGLFADQAGDALRDAILQAGDKAATQAAVDAWLTERGPLPPDADVLEKALDARRDRTLRDVVEAVGGFLPDAHPDVRKMLLMKMRTKARRSFDAKLSRMIQELLEQYGVED